MCNFKKNYKKILDVHNRAGFLSLGHIQNADSPRLRGLDPIRTQLFTEHYDDQQLHLQLYPIHGIPFLSKKLQFF